MRQHFLKKILINSFLFPNVPEIDALNTVGSTTDLDKGLFSSRRHLSELNQTEKKFSSLSRENRLNSLERENNKLLSPEKVLSLRRNSADPNQPTSQPLSSLMKSSRDEERSTTSKMSNHIHESKMSLNLSTNHLEPRSISPSKLSERIESRASIDNASNVKGKKT
jgi:hypothetical protein